MIKKQAQLGYLPGTEPKTTAPATTPGGTKTTTPGTAPAPTSGGVYTGNEEIKTMQRALIRLSQVVSAEMSFSNTPQGKTTREDHEAAGRANFGNFIAQHYLRNSDVSAVEFTLDPTKTKVEDKEPADPTRMSSVMDTMARIGATNGNEFIADGKWGPKTNAALINAKAFAEGMIKLANDFKVPVSYGEEDLAQFKTVPNDTDLSITQKIDWARPLTGYLEAIVRLFNQVKREVLQNPQFQTYIEGNAPLFTHEQRGVGADTIKNLETAFGNKLHVMVVDKGKQIDQPITVQDLLSPDTLKAWQTKHAPNTSLPDILASLKKTIGYMSGTQSAVPSAPSRT
jgi:hypothetical protein